MTCDVCGAAAVWRALCCSFCHGNDHVRVACGAHVARIVACHGTCAVEVVRCG